MRRRDFIKAITASAAAWPLAARGQQSAKPVVGFLSPTRAEEWGHLVAATRQGLRESDYSTGQVVIEPRWGNNQEGQLPRLADELVTLQVAVIVAAGVISAVVAKAATSNIPIVFVIGVASSVYQCPIVWRSLNVRFWHLADVRGCTAHVRFRGQSGHGDCIAECALMTQSGHFW